MANSASDTYRETRETAKHKARETATEKARELRVRTEEQADRWSSRAGRSVHSLASALRDASRSLRDENEQTLASWSEAAADQVDRVGSYLDEEDPGDMIDGLERTAREHPSIFIGGTLAAGLALGRFLRSSSRGGADGTDAEPTTEEIGSSERRSPLPSADLPPPLPGQTSVGTQGGPGTPSSRAAESSPSQSVDPSIGPRATGTGPEEEK